MLKLNILKPFPEQPNWRSYMIMNCIPDVEITLVNMKLNYLNYGIPQRHLYIQLSQDNKHKLGCIILSKLKTYIFQRWKKYLCSQLTSRHSKSAQTPKCQFLVSMTLFLSMANLLWKSWFICFYLSQWQ